MEHRIIKFISVIMFMFNCYCETVDLEMPLCRDCLLSNVDSLREFILGQGRPSNNINLSKVTILIEDEESFQIALRLFIIQCAYYNLSDEETIKALEDLLYLNDVHITETLCVCC